MIQYQSTRGSKNIKTAAQAVIQGIAEDKGLYVPDQIPALPKKIEELVGRPYKEVAFEIIGAFFTDYTKEEMKHCVDGAYDSKFEEAEIVPVTHAGGADFLELYHGKTAAFKDMALSILPYLLTTAMKKEKEDKKICILTATSGDTGKAAMAGFADVPGTKIIVFYPKNGVSRVQEMQMVTQKGANTSVVAIHGNFDNAQSGVKALFEDQALAKELDAAGYQFSSANSINIGRLVPQVVYYVYAYAKLLQNDEIQSGEKINVTVPTGNFGNILAAYYAKQMGVPINKLICASNENKVLFDFFRTGTYDKNREFVLTSSPSMDILISSNLERLIYTIAGQDGQKNAELMDALKSSGAYEITKEMKGKLDDFVGGYATEEQTAQAIHDTYKRTGYVMDTHTAVASCVCAQYREESGDETKCLIASTASPYKFVGSVMRAIDAEYAGRDEFELVDELEKLSQVAVPNAVKEIRDAKILHTRECDADKMKETVKEILEIEV